MCDAMPRAVPRPLDLDPSDGDELYESVSRVLFKPVTASSVSGRLRGRKSLAHLHSWDEIVYRNIRRVFKYKEFEKEWQLIVHEEPHLLHHISDYRKRRALRAQSRSKSTRSSRTRPRGSSSSSSALRSSAHSSSSKARSSRHGHSSSRSCRSRPSSSSSSSSTTKHHSSSSSASSRGHGLRSAAASSTGSSSRRRAASSSSSSSSSGSAAVTTAMKASGSSAAASRSGSSGNASRTRSGSTVQTASSGSKSIQIGTGKTVRGPRRGHGDRPRTVSGPVASSGAGFASISSSSLSAYGPPTAVPLSGYGHPHAFGPAHFESFHGSAPYVRTGYGAFHGPRAHGHGPSGPMAAAGGVAAVGEPYQVINGCYYYRPQPVEAVKPQSAGTAVRDVKAPKEGPTSTSKGKRDDVAEIEEVIVDENSQHSDGSNGSHGNISSLSQPINDSSSSTSLSSVTDNV